MSVLDTFGKKGKVPTTVQTQSLPEPLPPRRLGESYAAAQQQWADLEADLHETKALLATAKAHIQVIEESNAILHEDLEALRAENRRLLEQNTAIHERVTMSARILLSVQELASNPTASPPLPSRPLSPEEQGGLLQAVERVAKIVGPEGQGH